MWKRILSLTALVTLVAACHTSRINTARNPYGSAGIDQEVESFNTQMAQAKNDDLQLLSPQHYAEAEKIQTDVREMVRKDKTPEAISAELKKGWEALDRAQEYGQKSAAALAPAIAAREKAIRVGADKLDTDLQKIDGHLMEAAKSVEDDNVDKAVQKRAELTKDYAKLEMQAIKKFKRID